MSPDDSDRDGDPDSGLPHFGEAFPRYWLADPLQRARLNSFALRFNRALRDAQQGGRLARLALPRSRAEVVEAPAEETASEPELTYVGFQLVDKNGQPIPDEPFRAQLTDGRVVEDKLDASGSVRFDDIPRGICTISFPRINLHPRYRDGASAH